MIDLFIPSKNRAMQLRFLLESVAENMPSFFNEIKILYTYTNEDFEKGYEKLKKEKILPNIVWQKEHNLVEDFFKYLEDSDSDYICGMTDDCVVYKKVPASSQLVESMLEHEDVICFTLRLGLNTEIQSYLSEGRYVLTEYEENAVGIKWNYSTFAHTANYGYPITLDGHIYRPKELLDFSKRIKVETIRQWESHTVRSCLMDKDAKKYMSSFKQSILFSIPCNCVQYDESLLFGQIHEHSEIDLNKKYLNGEIISWDKMQYAFQNVNWAHNEVKLFFEEQKKE